MRAFHLMILIIISHEYSFNFHSRLMNLLVGRSLMVDFSSLHASGACLHGVACNELWS